MAAQNARSDVSRRGFVTGMSALGLGAAATAASQTGLLKTMTAKAAETAVPESWDYEYDIVVCGAGGAGLLAALKANDEGCKVICIDANFEMGGHAALSHGLTHSGGGTSIQQEYGIEELAQNIVNKYYEDYPMDPAVLAETVERYNSMVDGGVDEDFGKSPDLMTKKIETGPFYAAWSTPVPHDTLTGLRTDGHRQVLTVAGEPIEGLFACGECAGGMHTHGLGKVQTAGYIAGLYASQA